MSSYSTWRSYIRIARLDHWFKHVFMVPGVAVALFARPDLIILCLLITAALMFVNVPILDQIFAPTIDTLVEQASSD